MKKQIQYPLVITLLLLISVVPTLPVFGHSSEIELAPKVLGVKVRIDLTSQLEQLGYDTKTMTNVPETLLRKLVESYPSVPPDILKDNMQSTSVDENEYSYSVSFQAPQKPDSPTDSNNAEAGSSGYSVTSETKGCLIVVIGDYPGEEHDIDPEIHNVYVDLVNYATNYGGYQYITSLENSQATKEMVFNWLTWLCYSYDNVDVYLVGHGIEIWLWPFPIYVYGFVAYDGFYSNGDVNSGGIFYTWELGSGYYTHSAIRMTIAGGCYGWKFKDSALHPGWGPIQHTRAFAGPNGEVYLSYIEPFFDRWCYLWYQEHWDSSSARSDAHNYAWQQSQQGVGYNYADTGSQVWC